MHPTTCTNQASFYQSVVSDVNASFSMKLIINHSEQVENYISELADDDNGRGSQRLITPCFHVWVTDKWCCDA